MSWKNFRIQKRLELKPDIIEKIYSMISEIDGVKNSWKITEKLSPQALETLTRSVIITSTGASNRIEGNKLTDLEVEILYKNLNVKKFITRDEQEVKGYLKCLDSLFKNYEYIQINESSILQLHNDMLIDVDKDAHQKGHYKIGFNRVEAKDENGKIVGIIFDSTPPFLVKKEMQELIDWYHWAIQTKAKHPLILISNFIFEYLAIHPFADGNGRTSRLLTNLMLLHHGYNFTKSVSLERIIENNKVDYYIALNKTQSTWKKEDENISPWLIFMLNIIKQQSVYALKIMNQDSIEHLLSEKQLLFWQWANNFANNTFSRKDAVSGLNFPERTIESIIKKLVDLKRLERLGQARATVYKIIKSK